MLQIGRQQGAFLMMTCVVIVLVCFGAGFVAAVFLGGMDTATAAAVTGTVVAKSDFAVRARGSFLAQGQEIARRPVFALSKFAARPVQAAFRRMPGALKPLSPQMALDQALRNQVSGADNAVVAATSTSASTIQSSLGAAGTVPTGVPTAAGGAPTPTDPAKTTTAAARGGPPPPEVPRRNLPAAIPPVLVFSIELATFLQQDTLDQFVAEMQRRKLPVAILDQMDTSGRDWHHVRLSSFTTFEQATLRLAELRRDEGLSGVVISEPPAPPAPPPPPVAKS